MGETVRSSELVLEQLAEITAITRGIALRGRCFAVGDGPRRRVEIVLDADGQRAVVDVPPGLDHRALLVDAAEIFSESLAARR